MRLVTSWTGQGGCVWCMMFMPDGKELVCGSTDGVLKYWDVSSLGEKDPVEIRRFEGHSVRLLLEFLFFFSEHAPSLSFILLGYSLEIVDGCSVVLMSETCAFGMPSLMIGY